MVAMAGMAARLHLSFTLAKKDRPVNRQRSGGDVKPLV